MKTVSDADNWRKKYFESLHSLESEHRQFRAMESVLKRIVGRLCSASVGQSARLDQEVRNLQAAIRQEATCDELDRFTPGLTEAIQALDQMPAVSAPLASPMVDSAAAVTTAPIATAPAVAAAQPEPSGELVICDDRFRGIVAALLAELRRDPKLLKQVDILDSKLAAPMASDELPDILSSLTGLIGQRIQRIERSREEIEVLLSHMMGKLDEIGQFVAEQNQNQNDSLASSATLNVQLVGEMKAMGDGVESADNVEQIRTQVRSRLDLIGRHLQEFQHRETVRASVLQARNDQMRKRIDAMEEEALRVNHQLKDEQRLSSIDVLTNIPNRLAYEKRIEEEVKRRKRFKQPACVAVWDVDHFKRVNDAYGHRAGDRVLSTVAKSLASRIRGTDFVARYGGEEFVTIFSGTALAPALTVIEEMRLAISNIGFHFRGSPLSVTVSCGVTEILLDDSPETAFDRADKAMYRAKDGGRNRCVSS